MDHEDSEITIRILKVENRHVRAEFGKLLSMRPHEVCLPFDALIEGNLMVTKNH